MAVVAALTPAQRATQLARAAHALAAHDQAPSTVGDGVTFATREAPEIPVAPQIIDTTAGDQTTAEAVGARGGDGGCGDDDEVDVVADAALRERAGDVTNDVTEEAGVTLEQEQRDGAVADELTPDERPTLLGLPLMAGSLSGSSNPNPQNGPETTRRAARPPRPTRPVQPYDDAPAGNGAATHAQPAPTLIDAADEPTASRQAAPQRSEPPVAPTLMEAPAGLEPLAALTPLVSLGGVAPAAFAEAALAESATEGDEPYMATGSEEADEAAVVAPAPPQDNARLQAMDLNQQPLGPLLTDPPPAAAPADPAQSAPYPAAPPPQPYGAAPNAPRPAEDGRPPEWPGRPGQTPNPANGPNPPVNPALNPPMPPGAPLAPLGAQFGAPPPGYQSPYPAQAGGAPLPGQAPGDADAQLPTHAPWAVAASWGESSLSGPNTAAGMSYLFWWLSGIFVYFNERQNRFVRFHAMQSILLTGALTIISVLLFTILQLFDDAAAAAHQPAIAHIGLGIVIIGYALGVLAPWFGAMVAAWSGTYLRIPFIGDYAERFAAPPREVYPDSPPY